MTKYASKELVKKIQAGNNQAYKTFIEQYQRLVYHIVFRMIPNTYDREDICQDVFLKAYKHLATFRFECKLSTWIGKIAYTTCINFLQKKKIELYEDCVADYQSMDTITGSQITPDLHIEKSDIATRVKSEIEALPPNYRTILTLFHIDQMSYTEISSIMGLPEGTVKSYLFRARQQLKERLLSKYEEEELCSKPI